MFISNQNEHMQTSPLNENTFLFDLPTSRANGVDKNLIKMMRMNVAGTKGEELCRAVIFAEYIKCKEVFNQKASALKAHSLISS